jgi:hypothetical protein
MKRALRTWRSRIVRSRRAVPPCGDRAQVEKKGCHLVITRRIPALDFRLDLAPDVITASRVGIEAYAAGSLGFVGLPAAFGSGIFGFRAVTSQRIARARGCSSLTVRAPAGDASVSQAFGAAAPPRTRP